jgi:hypothetical protein
LRSVYIKQLEKLQYVCVIDSNIKEILIFVYFAYYSQRSVYIFNLSLISFHVYIPEVTGLERMKIVILTVSGMQ